VKPIPPRTADGSNPTGRLAFFLANVKQGLGINKKHRIKE